MVIFGHNTYEVYDMYGILIYVGYTKNPAAVEVQLKQKGWANEIYRVEFHRHSPERAAHNFVDRLKKYNRPIYNGYAITFKTS
jgi:hypothetical protein